MLRDGVDNWPMITAAELRDARVRAGFTSQAALAEALNVSERTVTSWEAEGSHVSTRAEARVRALLWPAPGPLSAYSDYELLSEIGRRLESARRHADELETTAEPITTDPGLSGKPEHRSDPPRAAWGRGPRPQGDRDNDVPRDTND